MEQRLQKILSNYGLASRRKAEQMILDRRVRVNGNTASLGEVADDEEDVIEVDGVRLKKQPARIVLMLNKPRGFITTMNDEHDRKCVAELVKDINTRVYPVGRLDRESEGLLIMTNDGEFTNALTHPSKHVSKTYRVTIRPTITKEQATEFRNGIEIDGRMTAPADLRVLEAQENRTVVEVTIYEGRNRQIRKMFEALGIEVARLKRTKVGNLKLGMLMQGAYRHLTEDEVSSLYELAGK